MLKSKNKWTGGRGETTSASDDEDMPTQARAGLSATDEHLMKDSSTGDKIPLTCQGIVLMWKRVLYAETEEAFEQAWRDLCKQFDDQRAILQYLYCLLMRHFISLLP